MTTIPEATAWRAVMHRDSAYDGRFVYAVRSTKIFCRPTCSSRRPTRSRVEFFDSADDARAAGYRACKRCEPATDGPSASDRAVARAADYIRRNADSLITLGALAREVGVSQFHLQRMFKRALGVTPRAFQDAERRRLLSNSLRKGDSVSQATFVAGYGSSSRVYERELGMTPGAIRKSGAGERIQYGVVASPLGRLLVGYTERGVCHVAIGDDDKTLERDLRASFSEATIIAAGSTIHEWIQAIVTSLEPGADDADIPVDARGTAFQLRVWHALQAIPRGTTLSYSEVAERIGQPTAVRAVARACATNPVALVIPCHRVVREDGGLGGYRWGEARKAALLERESAG